MGDPTIKSGSKPLVLLPKSPSKPPEHCPIPSHDAKPGDDLAKWVAPKTAAADGTWVAKHPAAPQQSDPHRKAVPADVRKHENSTAATVLHDCEVAAHGGKIAGAFGNAVSKLSHLGKAGFLAPLAAPFVAVTAFKDVRHATEEKSKGAINTAVGSVAYMSSVGNETVKLGIEVAEHRAAKKLAAVGTAKLAAHVGGKAAGRLVPGLSVAIAASDVVWAGSVVNDDKASVAKKTAAVVSAGASVVAAAASHIPVLGTVGAAIASGISAGALLLSNFL